MSLIQRDGLYREVWDGVFVADENKCFRDEREDWAVVHACKFNCHRDAVGYTKISASHPHYLHYEKGSHLYLNIVDPNIPLFKLETFHIFLDFAERMHNDGKTLLIHCNQGLSRSASLAMLFLAKHLKVLPNNTYEEASKAYNILDKFYYPSKGIKIFLDKNWSLI